jgi:hypothetical protein
MNLTVMRKQSKEAVLLIGNGLVDMQMIGISQNDKETPLVHEMIGHLKLTTKCTSGINLILVSSGQTESTPRTSEHDVIKAWRTQSMTNQ